MTNKPSWESEFRERYAMPLGDIPKGEVENIIGDIQAILTQREQEIEKERWEQPCKGCGHHDTMWKTLVTSPQWQEWEKYAGDNMLYDVDECRELGVMSKEHFQDFIKFLLKGSNNHEN